MSEVKKEEVEELFHVMSNLLRQEIDKAMIKCVDSFRVAAVASGMKYPELASIAGNRLVEIYRMAIDNETKNLGKFLEDTNIKESE